MFWRDKKRLWTILVAVSLLVSFLAAIVYYWETRETSAEDNIEIYVTDQPANFTRLDLTVAGVYIGDADHPLVLHAPRFNLLALHGPKDALLLASGAAPDANHTRVRVVFEAARAELNGVDVDVAIPAPMLEVDHDFGLGNGRSGAFLLDLDVAQSVNSIDGSLVFQPVVQAVYVHSYAPQPGSGSFARLPAFQDDVAQPPRAQRLDVPPPSLPSAGGASARGPSSDANSFASASSSKTPTPTGVTSFSGAPGSSDPTGSVDNGLPAPGGVQGLSPGADNAVGWLIQFTQNPPPSNDRIAAIIQSVGGQPYFFFGSVAAAYAFLTTQQAEALARVAGVASVEKDHPVQLQLASAKIATRVTEAQNPLTGLRDPSGRIVDGRGVGVGVIDIGFDAAHPDLLHRSLAPSDPVFAVNYKVESLFLIDAPETDVASTHGTHVAGIVAGRGVLDPTQKGVAPAARLYGFAIGELSTTLWPNTALDWIVQNANRVDPPIRVVTNSWGSGNQYEPNSLTTTLVNKLVDQGIVVVFAAGNAGGDGSVAATTSQCQIPREGVICVAAYSDAGTGTRDGTIADYSSRGYTAQPSTWPDLAAPGDAIRSTDAITDPNLAGAFSGYSAMSGTSMAAPHVAGIVALMLEVNPHLGPAQVESLLESTAWKFSRGGAYLSSADPRFDGDHPAKGHGLVDAYAAIQAASTS